MNSCLPMAPVLGIIQTGGYNTQIPPHEWTISLALTIYNLLLILGSPVILIGYFIKLYRRPDYRSRWAERLGFFPAARGKKGIHVHAVSLGESKVAARVVSELLQKHPQLPIIFTCSTATASAFIQQTFGHRVDHCYLPFDFPWVVAAFMKRFQPRMSVITEVEWWPNLIHQHHKKNNPVIMINAKMTDSSKETYLKFAPLFKDMAKKTTQVLVQTPTSLSNFAALGLQNEQLQLSNNIKFDEPSVTHLPAHINGLKSAINKSAINGRKVWIAGSTHAEDEIAVLFAFKQLKEQHPELLLILVPRHPERFNTVYENCLAQHFSVARRSKDETITATTDILLGDTLGELSGLYSLADYAFIGGSITKRGGHNPLEAAIYGIPLIMGPSQFNSLDIIESLENAGALTVVNDGDALHQTIEHFISNPAISQQAGQSSANAIAANQGALAQTLAYLEQTLTQENIH